MGALKCLIVSDFLEVSQSANELFNSNSEGYVPCSNSFGEDLQGPDIYKKEERNNYFTTTVQNPPPVTTQENGLRPPRVGYMAIKQGLWWNTAKGLDGPLYDPTHIKFS